MFFILRQLILLGLFIFPMHTAFSQDTSCCCEQLRKEVQVIKERQDKLLQELRRDESSEKKNFSYLEELIDIFANEFPELKEVLKKFKNIYHELEKNSNPIPIQ
jgi:hypothetical protein